jgi:hypothetical protein
MVLDADSRDLRKAGAAEFGEDAQARRGVVASEDARLGL